MNDSGKLVPVLVVDDDDDIRKTLGCVLRSAGCQVELAPDGPACLRILREGFHGLILMDIMMPGWDGWATIHAIVDGDLLQGNLICMLTALADPGPDNEDLAGYVFDYLVKPFDGVQLLEIVRLAGESLGS